MDVQVAKILLQLLTASTTISVNWSASASYNCKTKAAKEVYDNQLWKWLHIQEKLIPKYNLQEWSKERGKK